MHGAGGVSHIQVAAAAQHRQIHIQDDAPSNETYRRLHSPRRSSSGSSSAPRTLRSILVTRSGSSHVNTSADAQPTETHSPPSQRIVKFARMSVEDETIHVEDDAQPQPVSASATSLESSGTTSSSSEGGMPREWNPAIQLRRITNRFRDERLEESYQLYSSTCDLPVARRVIVFVLFAHVLAYLLYVYLRNTSTTPGEGIARSPRIQVNQYAARALRNSNGSGSGVTPKTYRWSYRIDGDDKMGPWIDVALWSFAPFAFIYAFLPLKYVEGSMRLRIGVYYFRRRWKRMASFILLLWAIGIHVFVFMLLQQLKMSVRPNIQHTARCANSTLLEEEWYAHSRWSALHADRPKMTLLDWIIIYDAKVTNSLVLGVLAVLSTLSGILFVALKLDFVHVVFNTSALWLTCLCLLFGAQQGKQNSRSAHRMVNQLCLFVFGIVIPSMVTLLATYTEDRATRMAYASKVRAERINTTLKLDLSTKRSGLENKNIDGDDQSAMEKALFHDGSELLREVSIPFAELQLKEMVAKNPYGEILLADYHGTRVVLKRLALSSCTPEGMLEFKAKVEMQACLRHPNIVLFIGATYDNLANVGMIMEYLERGDVASLLRSSIALTWNDPLLKIATDVAQGVSYLHNCDPPLVHRDLKASNLLATATFSCKISDFGESKRQTVAGNLFSTIVGTPYWVAPEVLREEKYDISVDCYSFGIVLIELETRKDPYFELADESTIEVMMQVANRGLRPTIPATCPPNRRKLITSCLASNPKDRPKMTDILHSLQNEVRQELLTQDTIGVTCDKRRMMLMQRHQVLNRRGVRDLLGRSDSPSDDASDSVLLV